MTSTLLRTGRGPGGIRVAALRLPGRASAALAAGVPFGARDDPTGQEGMAHLLEHVLFRGGPDGSAEDSARALARAGAETNATTGHDDLRLNALVLPDGIPETARILGGILHAARLADADIEHERRVVLQELAEHPDEGGVGALLDVACWGAHPLARPVAGTAQSLTRIRPASLRHAARNHLGPATSCAVAVGDAEPDAMLRALIEGFGGASRARAPQRRAPRFQGGLKWQETDEDDPVADVALAYPAPAAGDPGTDAAHLAAALLGGGPTSTLFLALRERHGIVYGVEARLEQGKDWGRLCIDLRLPADRLDDGLALLSRSLDDPPEADRIAEIRRVEILQTAASLDSPDGVAQTLLSDLLNGRPAQAPSERLERLRKTPETAVAEMLQRILAGPPALAILGPAPCRRTFARTRFADLACRLPR